MGDGQRPVWLPAGVSGMLAWFWFGFLWDTSVIMQLRPIRLVLLTAALAAGSVVLAQTATSDADLKAAAKEEDDAADDTPASKYTEEANEALASMRVSLQKGLDEVKKARDEKDALRLTCVNEPVTAMKGVLRVAEDANVDLQEAIATSQTAQARREFRKVKKSKARMDNLLSEAQNCAGADSSVSTTSVEVTIDEDVIAIDPYYGSPDFFFDPSDTLVDGDPNDLGDTDPLRPPPASGVL